MDKTSSVTVSMTPAMLAVLRDYASLMLFSMRAIDFTADGADSVYSPNLVELANCYRLATGEELRVWHGDRLRIVNTIATCRFLSRRTVEYHFQRLFSAIPSDVQRATVFPTENRRATKMEALATAFVTGKLKVQA